MKSLLILFSLPVLAAITAPRGGVILTREGAVREISGIAGAFVSGDTLLPLASQVACSGQLVVAKLEHSVGYGEAEFEAPLGGAIFGFSSDGAAAYAYFPTDRSFARIGPNGLESIPLDVGLLGGEVVALAGSLTVWVRRDDGLHAIGVRLSDGAVESDTPLGFDARMAVALPGGTIVYAHESSIIAVDSAGKQQTQDLPIAVESLALMGDGWIHARTAESSFAIRVRSGALELFYLPEAPIQSEPPIQEVSQ